MRIAGLSIVAALALAACEDGAPEQNMISVRAANPTSDNLKKLDPLYRHLGLWRGIRYNRGTCKRVDRGAYQQEYKNMAMWRAHCIDSGDWAVFIAPDATVQAIKCADARTLGLPECKPIPAEAAQPAKEKKAPAP